MSVAADPNVTGPTQSILATVATKTFVDGQINRRVTIPMSDYFRYLGMETADRLKYLKERENAQAEKPNGAAVATTEAAPPVTNNSNNVVQLVPPVQVAQPAPAFGITFFPNYYATSLRFENKTPPDLQKIILETTAPAKDKLPLLMTARLGDKRTEKGSLRHDANVLVITGVPVDYDGEKFSFNEAVTTLQRAKIFALIYTSPSHTSAKPRWRIIAPTSKELPPQEHAKLVARINGLFGGIFASESFTLSQSYYYGSVKNNPEHQAIIIKGDFIDQRNDLDAGAIGNTRATAAPTVNAPAAVTNAQLAAMLSGLVADDFEKGSVARELAYACHDATKGAGRAEWLAFCATYTKPRKQIDWPTDVWDRAKDNRADGITYRTLFKIMRDAGRADLLPLGPLVSAGDHMARARSFIEAKRPNLKDYREDFSDYHAGRYAIVKGSTVRANIYGYLDNCTKIIKDGSGKNAELIRVPFNPDTKAVNETIGALRAVAHVKPEIDQPHWLDGRDSPDPVEVVSFPNGILDLAANKFLPPSPMLFTSNAVGFDYDPNASEPKEFKDFLNQIFDGEQEQIDALQEWFGYCITSDVSQEKAFMLLGPPRSGKDTIRHTLQSIISSGAICSPTLGSLGTDFGMSQLIGKSLCIIGDMRIDHKTDQALLAENVLKLTGRGFHTINRKYQGHWEGVLPCKLVMISNDRPKLQDASGALAGRFNIVRTQISFFGRENPNLFRDKIRPELPGILLWALCGLRRMRERGRLLETKNSIEERTTLAREASPVLAFIDERLKFDANKQIDKDVLYEQWKNWAATAGLCVNDKATFFRDFQSAAGDRIKSKKPRTEDEPKRRRVIAGIRLKTEDEQKAEDEQPDQKEIPF